MEREIQRIEAQDRLFRWKTLQKVKEKNDVALHGMIGDVHRLMEEYGLRPKNDMNININMNQTTTAATNDSTSPSQKMKRS